MKAPGKTSAATQKAYESIGQAGALKGVTLGKMFGMASLTLKGKAFAGVFGDSMVFKLTGEAHAKALALRGAKLFDPSGMGRPMKQWIVVPKAHRAAWSSLAVDARDALE